MAEEEIICSQCKQDLVMKFIAFKDLVFCSNQCLETFRDKMGQKRFQREYGDVFLPGEGKGWVPKQANEYIKMCGPCPKKLTEACQEEREISAVYHDSLADSEEYRWCCHATFCLSAALSDGTVPLNTVLKVQRYAENKAREQDLRGVLPVTLNQSFADLVKNFEYKKLQEDLPELRPAAMSHFGACLLCDEPFGRQCEALCEREFQLVPKVKPLVEKPWCAHGVSALADMLIDREDGEELLRKIISFADHVAQEKAYPGVTTRNLFIALGRML
jgi:hypothetical protein